MNKKSAATLILILLLGLLWLMPAAGTAGEPEIISVQEANYGNDDDFPSTRFLLPLSDVFGTDTFTFEELGTTDGQLPNGFSIYNCKANTFIYMQIQRNDMHLRDNAEK